MEFSSSLLFSSLFLLSLLFHTLQLTNRHRSSRLPPGPRNLPIIGSLHRLLGSLPHHTLAALSKQHGPVMLLQLGEVPTLVVSSPAAAAAVMKTHDLEFSSRPMTLTTKTISYGGKGIIFNPYGTYWREVRKMSVVELLSVKQVLSFRSIREAEALNLVRSLAGEVDGSARPPAVNLSARLMRLTNDISARAVIGGKCGYQKEFLAAVTQAMEEIGGFRLVDQFPSWSRVVGCLSGAYRRTRRLHRKFDVILESVIEEHKQRSGDREGEGSEDLIDVLLRVQHNGSLPFPLPHDSVKAIALDLFAAGGDTSATVLEWAMSELIRNPTAMRRVQTEVRAAFAGEVKPTEKDVEKLSYFKLVIKESLRLHPPAPLLLPRECVEATDLLGYRVQAGTRVLVNAWAIARDPRVWGEDAEQFKPERFEETAMDFRGTNFAFIPFGAGRRMCPGIAFGLANVEFALACLLHYFDWRLPDSEDGAELDMTEARVGRRRSACAPSRALPAHLCLRTNKKRVVFVNHGFRMHILLHYIMIIGTQAGEQSISDKEL